MSFFIRLTLTASAVLTLASCGGGTAHPPPSAGGAVTPPPGTATTGRAVDGYISAGTAVCDVNGNGVADSGEASVITSSTGLYTFAAGCNAVVMVSGGTNVDTGLPFRGVLKTPAGAAIASPLTTLLVAGLTQAQVNAAVGLPAGTNLTTLDPAVRTNGALDNPDLLKRTLALQQLLQKTTEMFVGLGGVTSNVQSQAIYTEVVAAFAAQLPTAPAFGAVADASVVAALVKAATQRVAAAAAMPAGVRSALATLNADSLAQVVTGGMKFQVDAILGASGNAIPTAGGAQQADGRITAFVLTHAAALGGAPGTATQALAEQLTAQISGTAPPSVPGPVIGPNGELVTFEESTPPVLTGFGGAEDSTIVTDPVSNSGKVAKVVKAAGSEVWAGTTVSVGPNFSIARIPFTASATTLTVRVWSPDANVPVRLKVEDAADGNKAVETEARTTVAGAWQTLSFNFANHVGGTPALNLATTYNKATIFFDFGTAGAGKTYYFDDLRFGAAAEPPPPPVANNYMALADDSISLVTGNVVTPYSMAAFQSDAGISVSWPLSSTARLRVQINEIGAVVIPAGQKVSAAVSITETTPNGRGEIQAYIDNVDVSKTAEGLQVTVPAGGMAMVYGVSGDGNKKAVIDFSGDVSTGLVTNLLRTAAGTSNDILLGNVVNFAINRVSNDFTGIYQLRGKYRVTIVLKDLALRKADGSALPELTVTVPTALNATGGVASSKVITGAGLTGFITLTD